MSSRQAKLHVPTLSGMSKKSPVTHRFLKRKMEEYEALKAEIEMLRLESEGKKQGSIQKGEV